MSTTQTPESITHQLYELAKANGTTFAQEYRNYHPRAAQCVTWAHGSGGYCR